MTTPLTIAALYNYSPEQMLAFGALGLISREEMRDYCERHDIPVPREETTK